MIPIKDKRGQRRGWKAPLTTAVVAGLLATTGMTASAASSDDQSTIAVTSDSGRSGGQIIPCWAGGKNCRANRCARRLAPVLTAPRMPIIA